MFRCDSSGTSPLAKEISEDDLASCEFQELLPVCYLPAISFSEILYPYCLLKGILPQICVPLFMQSLFFLYFLTISSHHHAIVK